MFNIDKNQVFIRSLKIRDTESMARWIKKNDSQNTIVGNISHKNWKKSKKMLKLRGERLRESCKKCEEKLKKRY